MKIRLQKTLQKPEESISCLDAVSNKVHINKIISVLSVNQPLFLHFLLLHGTTENYIIGKLKICYLHIPKEFILQPIIK